MMIYIPFLVHILYIKLGDVTYFYFLIIKNYNFLYFFFDKKNYEFFSFKLIALYKILNSL